MTERIRFQGFKFQSFELLSSRCLLGTTVDVFYWGNSLQVDAAHAFVGIAFAGGDAFGRGFFNARQLFWA